MDPRPILYKGNPISTAEISTMLKPCDALERRVELENKGEVYGRGGGQTQWMHVHSSHHISLPFRT